MNSSNDKGVNSQVAGLVSVTRTRTAMTWRLASLRRIPSCYFKKRATDASISGVVFLPAAGYRNGTTVNNAGSNGNYWPSTAFPSNASRAYRVYFGSGNLNLASGNNRGYGYSVRLVRVVQ